MVRLCGGGGAVVVVMAIEPMIRGEVPLQSGIVSAVVSTGVIVLLGMLGARIACRIASREPAPTDQPPIPAATLAP